MDGEGRGNVHISDSPGQTRQPRPVAMSPRIALTLMPMLLLTSAEIVSEMVTLEPGEMLCNCSLQAALCGLAAEGPYKFVCKTKGGCLKNLYRPSPEDHPELIRTEYRCVPLYHWTPPERPIMCETHEGLAFQHQIGCCRGDFCAAALNVSLPDRPKEPAGPPGTSTWELAAMVMVPLVVLSVLFAGYVFVRRRLRGLAAKRSGKARSRAQVGGDSEVAMLSDFLNYVEDQGTSGSGSGFPLLVQRTVARQIEKIRKVGEGRFGMVWLGRWKGDEVAVKIFATRDEKSWFREVEIFQTNMLRHPNILTFLASDNMDATTHTELWLVTEYHAGGSLYDHLRANAPTLAAATLLARSLANGLAFLHAENVGTHSKPAIAHRDIKSKNVLVKANGECCLADLGMAVRYSGGDLDMPDNGKAGTRRYCAPEVLDDSINLKQFESFRRADIYSTGLTLWEICRRTDFDGVVESYELPYHDSVDSDPSREAMRVVVCDERRRPLLPNSWTGHPVMGGMAKLLRECWASNPSARLPALRVKKTIDSLSAASLPPSLSAKNSNLV